MCDEDDYEKRNGDESGFDVLVRGMRASCARIGAGTGDAGAVACAGTAVGTAGASEANAFVGSGWKQADTASHKYCGGLEAEY